MNEKRKPMEYLAEMASTYQTGTTSPPKSHVGLVAFLLSLTIFICGLSTIFSLMRINLLQKLIVQTENQACTLAFAQPAKTVPAERGAGLQIQGRSLNAFWQSYHGLPQGIYVTYACGQPLQTGDIITSFGQTPVADWETVNALLAQYAPGDTVPVTVYRNGKHTQINLTIYEE